MSSLWQHVFWCCIVNFFKGFGVLQYEVSDGTYFWYLCIGRSMNRNIGIWWFWLGIPWNWFHVKPIGKTKKGMKRWNSASRINNCLVFHVYRSLLFVMTKLLKWLNYYFFVRNNLKLWNFPLFSLINQKWQLIHKRSHNIQSPRKFDYDTCTQFLSFKYRRMVIETSPPFSGWLPPLYFES